MNSWPAREVRSYECNMNSIERSERRRRCLQESKKMAKVRLIEEGMSW